MGSESPNKTWFFYAKLMDGSIEGEFILPQFYVTCWLLFGRDRFAKAKSPPTANIAPPTKGNPAPTKSAILDENRNGKQKNIPKIPAVIEAKAPNFATLFISNIVLCSNFGFNNSALNSVKFRLANFSIVHSEILIDFFPFLKSKYKVSHKSGSRITPKNKIVNEGIE